MAKQKKELDRFDTNAKRNIPILAKLLFILAFSVIISIAGVAIVELEFFDSGVRESTDNDLTYFAKGLEMTLNDWLDGLVSDVELVATGHNIEQCINESNEEEIQEFLEKANETLKLDFIAITEKSGKAIAGTKLEDDKVVIGTDFSTIKSVQDALRGNHSYSYEDVDGDFSIVATAPVEYEGETIGTVVASYSLENGYLVNQIKESYAAECTIFKDSTRVSTSLGDDLVGTTLDSSEIIQTVLKNGEPFHGTNKINGGEYISFYIPLKSNSGEIAGMAFIARSMSVVEKIKSHTILVMLPISLAVIALLMLVMYRFISWLMWRISNVTNFLKDLETGDADLTKRCKLFIRDEIGDLIIHFDFFLDKLQQIMAEIKGTNGELKDSGENLAAGTEDTASVITQIIQNINGIHSQIETQSGSVGNTAVAVNEISGNITELDELVQDQSSGVAQASASIEEMIGNISSVTSSVDKMAQSFEALNNNVQTGFSKQQDVNDKILQIERQSEMLEEANSAISSIAEQTNLLAMNAAIEAAHAGEAGKGFSVVADEIRKLSETSGEQSRSIGDQLSKIRESIKDVVSSSNEASEAFGEVSKHVKETDMLVVQIKSAMEEQNEGSRQIGDALRTMNESTVKVQKASKEMSQRNERIMSEMQNLQNATGDIQTSMQEMSVGAKKISSTGESLAGISGDVLMSIAKIGSQIDRFKTA